MKSTRFPLATGNLSEVRLRQEPARISASYEVLEGSTKVRPALMLREDLERMSDDLPGSIAVTPKDGAVFRRPREPPAAITWWCWTTRTGGSRRGTPARGAGFRRGRRRGGTAHAAAATHRGGHQFRGVPGNRRFFGAAAAEGDETLTQVPACVRVHSRLMFRNASSRGGDGLRDVLLGMRGRDESAASNCDGAR